MLIVCYQIVMGRLIHLSSHFGTKISWLLLSLRK